MYLLGDYLRLGAVSFLQLQQESYACTLEAQPEYLLLYVKEGTMYLVRNRVEAMYSAGSLLLLPPEEEYRLHFAREKQASAYWLSFSGFSITKLLVDSGLMNQPVFHTPPDCDLSYLFEGILRQSLPSPRRPAHGFAQQHGAVHAAVGGDRAAHQTRTAKAHAGKRSSSANAPPRRWPTPCI